MTGLPAIAANNLSKPMRRLSPAATMIAVSIGKTVKRVTTLQGVCSLKKFRFDFVTLVTFLTAQLLLHFRAQRFAVDATSNFRLQRLHHGTHLRFRCGADFGDAFAHD